MANNSIDLIVGKEAIAQVENLISKLTITDQLMLKTSQSALALAKATSSISSTSGLTNNTAENAAITAETQKYIKTVEVLEKKIISLTAAKKNNQEASLQDKVDARIALQNATAEAKAVSTKIDAYTRLDLAHKKAMQSAKNVGTTYGSTSLEFKKAAERANKLDAELKAIDETLGKNNRNVGNYKSGWNGLGNSINQLTREMPAFAVSANTGFLALSNNIPILVDEISRLKAANIELAKSGEPTKSVFKAIGGALFSWGTALSIGVTVLTLYGGKIATWIGQITKGKEALNELKKSQETLNKAFEDTSVKNAVENVNELTINIGLAKQGFLDKEQVLKQYNETIGGTTGLVDNLDEAEQALIKNADAYIKMTLYKAAATLAQQDAAKQLLEAEKSRLKELKDFAGQNSDIGTSVGSTAPGYDPTAAARIAKKDIEAQKKRKQEEIKINEDAANVNLNIAKKFQTDAAKIADKFDFNLFGDTKKEKEKKVKQEKAKREDLDHLQSYIKPVGTIVDEINAEIDRLTTEKIIANAEELPAVNEQLRLLLLLRQQLNELPKGGALPDEFVKPEDVEKVKELTNEMKNYLRSFVDEFAGNSGFEGVLHLFDGEDSLFSRMQEGMAFTKDSWKSDTVEMMEGVQEMYNFISDASKANFEGEYNRLEEQKKTALKFAGESASAKEKIEADYEKKRKEIANRENKAKQKQAIFNIAIDTAQGIISALASTPPNVPLSVAIGVLGATQIAMVAAQKIPQYFKGGTHDGGLMLVNDAKGSNYQETIVTPDGKIMQPTERNVLMDAPSGTQIFTPEQWHEKQLFEMMQGKGIAMTNNYAKSNGLTYEQMDAVIGKHFANITTQTNVFDRNGFSSYSSKQGNITIRNNNRSQGIGFSV